MRKVKALYLSYNGLLEPILPSQAVPYLAMLAKENIGFILITYEKPRDIKRTGRQNICELKERLRRKGIEWRFLLYHKNPPFISTFFDLLAGMIYAAYIIISKRVTILHVIGITPGMIAITLSKVLRVKILFDMRGLLAEEYVGGGLWREEGAPFRLVKKAEKHLLLIADAVTVLTKKHRDFNRRLGYLTQRNIPIEVVPCCVDMERFFYDIDKERTTRVQLGLEKKFVLMYPGKLGTFYMINEMLDFYKILSETIPDTTFFVVTNDDFSA